MRISLRNVVIFTSLSLFVCITFVLHRSIDVGPLQKISLSQNEKISLEKVEEKLRKVEDQIATNNVVMQKMRDKLRREMEIIRNSKQLTGEEKDGQLMIEDNEKGVLLPPKRREQIVREAQNEQKAIERAQDEEQARRGVIPMPPESSAEVGNNLKQGGKAAVVHSQLHRTPVNTIYHANKNFCASQMNITRPSDDIQMLDVYEKLSFEDRDGGVWKQGFDISYSSAEVKRQPTLEVIVVPHSHNDPGWIRTFEEYFHMQTKDILDLMLKHLNSQDSMRFIYAEISFFELWWRYLNDQQRAGVKTLLENGRLEIVTGGWVMTDEANSHYFAIITELFEGHEWLKNNIGSDHRPKTHWSIDPFGLSPTVAYLMNRANVSNAVVQRVHYSVKKFLAETKQLEFRWRQLFAGESSDTDMITQVMPFFSYDVPHTCGPDPAICCQFDFRRLPKRDIDCPWKLPPVLIDDANVAER
ncbi:hypothetical protein AB6A40_010089 [Gnathostoma spinigerum]|uniref:Glycoside hydrolase family 38 N-terminal domain-containing protein n=1 Tax=Gnathostoma spinigerum TaxID=75299 RepID=A0ABD6EV48_9BILA